MSWIDCSSRTETGISLNRAEISYIPAYIVYKYPDQLLLIAGSILFSQSYINTPIVDLFEICR